MEAPDVQETLDLMQARLGYRRLIDHFGNQSIVAKKLDLSPATVCQWKFRGVPARYVDRLRQMTGLQLHELRPDMFSDPSEEAK